MRIDGIDPRDLIMTYGERRLGDTRGYVIVTRRYRPDGSEVGLPRRVVFQSDSKSAAIAEAQRLKGWEPVDGSEQTYGQQILEHDGESR